MVRSSVSPFVPACQDNLLRVGVPAGSTNPPPGYIQNLARTGGPVTQKQEFGSSARSNSI